MRGWSAFGPADEGLGPLQAVARESLVRARTVGARLHAGIKWLAADETAADAFRFANRAMWLQRGRGRTADHGDLYLSHVSDARVQASTDRVGVSCKDRRTVT